MKHYQHLYSRLITGGMLCFATGISSAVSSYSAVQVQGLIDALAVSDQQVVAGQVGGGQTSDGWPHAAEWDNGVVTDLGMYGCKATVSSCWSKAYDINSAGRTVGESFTENQWIDNPYWSFMGTQPWGVYFAHETKWDNGAMKFVKAVGWEYGTLTGVNSFGDMVGHGRSVNWPDPNVSGDYIVHGYFLNGSSVQEIGSYGQYSKAFGVNDNDQVTGEIKHGGITQAFIWQSGAYTALGHLGGGSSAGLSINSNTQPIIVGNSKVAGGATHGFSWQNGVMTDLGTLGGGGGSSAVAINDAGQIVGASGGVAVLWEGGQIHDLNTLVNGPYLGLTKAIDVNQNGDILVKGSGGFYLLSPN